MILKRVLMETASAQTVVGQYNSAEKRCQYDRGAPRLSASRTRAKRSRSAAWKGRNWRKFAVFAAAALLLACLTGCAKQEFGAENDGSFTVADIMDESEPIESSENDVSLDAVDPEEEPDPAALGITGAASRNSDDPLSPAAAEQRDSVEKADIFWKLNWLKESVRSGVTPPDMDTELADIEARIEATADDEIKTDLRGVAQTFRTGLEAYQLEAKLRAAGKAGAARGRTMPNLLALSTERSPSPARRPEKFSLNRYSDERLEAELTAFRKKHHSSPSIVKTLAFSEAAEKTAALQEKMQLKDPEEEVTQLRLGSSDNPFSPDETE